MKEHRYRIAVEWTGNQGSGTSSYTGYKRDHEVSAGAKPVIPCSSDPSFRGDPARWNPEELFVASLSTCHKLWYLHLCSASGIAVLSYRDEAEGLMVEDASGGGRFSRVVLRPNVVIRSGDDAELAERLHHDAHAKCFIANSVNFPVECEPAISDEASRDQSAAIASASV